jgi:hypothetical protein
MGSGVIGPSIILDLGTRWRQVVSFTAMHLLDRRLCGPQSLSGHCGEEKIPASARNQNPAIQSIACHYMNRAIEDNIKK